MTTSTKPNLQNFNSDIGADGSQARDESQVEIDPGNHQQRQHPEPGPACLVLLPEDGKKSREQNHREHFRTRTGASRNTRDGEDGERCADL